jgi:hypothetical protein
MRRKLPIAETAIDSIVWAARAVWPTIRLGWLLLIAYLGLVALGLYLLAQSVPGLAEYYAEFGRMVAEMSERGDFENGNYETYFETMPVPAGSADLQKVVLGGLVILLGTLIFLPLLVLLMRVAAGDIPFPRGFFYFRWGSREWRTLLTLIVYGIVLSLAQWVIAALGELGVRTAENSGDLTLTWVPAVIGLGVFVATLWVTLRTILIVPAAAIEDDINPGAAVRATGGNFFRLLGSAILLGLTVLVTIIAMVIGIFVVSILAGLAINGVGEATGAGQVLGAVFAFLLLAAMIAFYLGLQLVQVGWLAKSWAALRPS